MLSLQQSALRATPLNEMFSLLYPRELLRMHINDFQDETYWDDYRVERISKDILDSFLASFYPYEYTRPEEALDFILRILLTENRLIEYSISIRESDYFLWYKRGDQYILILSDDIEKHPLSSTLTS